MTSDNPQKETGTPEPAARGPAATTGRRSRLSSGAIALLVGIASSCLLWPLLIRAGVEPIVAVPLLGGWPLVVWALARAVRSVARRRSAAAAGGARGAPGRDLRATVAIDAEQRAARGEQGWIVELSTPATGGIPATVIRVVLQRASESRYGGSHELSRARQATRRAALGDSAATSLGRWLDTSSPWDAPTAEHTSRVAAAARSLAVTIEIASFDAEGVRHACVDEVLDPAPRDARDFWVHRLLAQLFDLGSKAPWVRVDVRGRDVRWSAARANDDSFRPDVGGVSFWVGPDEREPDELVLVLSDAKSRDGSSARWPDALRGRSSLVARLPPRGAPGVSALELERRTVKRPGSAVERHGAWALIDGQTVTFWLPVVVGVHSAFIHRALGLGAEPSLRI